MGIGTEVLIVLLLLVANGVFAMSEIALVSARKSRLQQRAEAGDHAARRALHLAEHPERFLATVQVGITLVGTLAGAFGGAAIAEPLAAWLKQFPSVAEYARPLSLGIVVLGITYMSLIVGELVPKQIGLNHPEKIAAAMAGPMDVVSRVARPLVWLLTTSTRLVLRMLRIRKPEEAPVTEAEIAVLLEQGTQAGVFEEEEQELVERVFWLGDQRVVSLMTPRHRIVWLDVTASPEEHRRAMVEHRFSRYLVCDGGLDHVLGMVEVKDLWAAELAGRARGDAVAAAAAAVHPREHAGAAGAGAVPRDGDAPGAGGERVRRHGRHRHAERRAGGVRGRDGPGRRGPRAARSCAATTGRCWWTRRSPWRSSARSWTWRTAATKTASTARWAASSSPRWATCRSRASTSTPTATGWRWWTWTATASTRCWSPPSPPAAPRATPGTRTERRLEG